MLHNHLSPHRGGLANCWRLAWRRPIRSQLDAIYRFGCVFVWVLLISSFFLCTCIVSFMLSKLCPSWGTQLLRAKTVFAGIDSAGGFDSKQCNVYVPTQLAHYCLKAKCAHIGEVFFCRHTFAGVCVCICSLVSWASPCPPLYCYWLCNNCAR